jgi:ferredoxin
MPRIHFATSGQVVEFPEGDEVNLLRVAIRNDVKVPWRCASGNCGTDRVKVADGAECLSAPRKRERDRLGDLLHEGYRLACQTYVGGDVTVVWDPDQEGLDADTAAARRLRQVWLGKEDTA